MPRLRSILSLILVLVATFLVSCGGSPQAAIPTTYSPAKIEQLKVLIDPIQQANENMAVLEKFIADRNWGDIQTYLHGPLGVLRQEIASLNRSLLPKDQKQAAQLGKAIFSHFERIDTAAKDRNAAVADYHFRLAERDLQSYFDLLPQAS